MSEAMALTDVQVRGLLSAYLERKRVEAKIMISMVAEAMKKPKQQEMSLGALAAMGFGIRLPEGAQ